MAKTRSLSDDDLSFLEQRYLELSDLFEVSGRLSSSLNYRAIVDQMLLSLMGRMMIPRGMFLISDGDGLKIVAAKGLGEVPDTSRVSASEIPDRSLLVTELAESSSLRTFLENHGLTILFPVSSRHDLRGALAFGDKSSGRPYDQNEINFVSSLTSIAGTSIDNSLMLQELQDVNHRLDRRNQELRTLFELGRELNATLDIEVICGLLGRALMGQLMISKYVLFLEIDGKLGYKASRGLGSEEASKVIGEIDSAAPNLPALGDHLVLPETTNLVTEDEKAAVHILEELGFAALIPMRLQNRTKGLIAVWPKSDGEALTGADLEFLMTLGSLAIVAVENARLFEEAVEMQRIEEELALARDIQARLLISDFPQLESFEIAARNIPSREVGGDYYDAIPLGDERFAITIADVVGKGVPAALLMANLQASLRALCQAEVPLAEVVDRVNKLLYESTTSDIYITFFLGFFDGAKGTLSYVNAGHNPPFYLTAEGDAIWLSDGGMILGFTPDSSYEQGSLQMRQGDRLVLYTDGVTETVNPEGNEFGESRLEEVVRANATLSAKELLSAVNLAVSRFSDEHALSDDMTLLVVAAS